MKKLTPLAPGDDVKIMKVYRGEDEAFEASFGKVLSVDGDVVTVSFAGHPVVCRSFKRSQLRAIKRLTTSSTT